MRAPHPPPPLLFQIRFSGFVSLHPLSGFDDFSLSLHSDMASVAKAMASPESGLEVRDRMWLKITIPNAFLGKRAAQKGGREGEREGGREGGPFDGVLSPKVSLLPSHRPGSDVVEWLFHHIEGFQDRREARKYASNLLKAGFIRHTVNKITFSEQCYYVFGDLSDCENCE